MDKKSETVGIRGWMNTQTDSGFGLHPDATSTEGGGACEFLGFGPEVSAGGCTMTVELLGQVPKSDAILAYCRNAALEEAAKVCDARVAYLEGSTDPFDHAAAAEAEELAAAIRARKT